MSHTAACKRAYHFICENLDQDTSSPQCRTIRKHLEGCSACREYLASLKKTVKLYKLLPAPRVPKSVHRDLFKRLACLGPLPESRTHKSRPGPSAKR